VTDDNETPTEAPAAQAAPTEAPPQDPPTDNGWLRVEAVRGGGQSGETKVRFTRETRQ